MNLNFSILVVTYKRPDLVKRFHSAVVSSLKEHTGWELLYADHTPGRSVTNVLSKHANQPHYVLHNPSNPGFAAGVNCLNQKASRDWLILLNPDVFGFTSDMWKHLALMRQADAAIFGMLQNEFNKDTDCFGEFPSLLRPFRRRKVYKYDSGLKPVETAIMAFMCVSAATFKRVGQLDEDYFMYAEDMDWCYRAKRVGVRRLLDTSVRLTHLGAQSALEDAHRKTIALQKYYAEEKFIWKNYQSLNRYLMLCFNRIKIFGAKL